MSSILASANDILIDLNGQAAYLQDFDLWVYDSSDPVTIGATIEFNNSDLGVPEADKLLNFVDVDYIGAFNLTFYLDGVARHTMVFNSSVTRTTKWLSYPLSKRKAFQKLKLVLTASEKTTKIYGIEIDFDIIRRRRYD